jgi:hypothetical protein
MGRLQQRAWTAEAGIAGRRPRSWPTELGPNLPWRTPTTAGLGELDVRDAGHVAERDGAEHEHDRYGMPSCRAITIKAGIATHRPRIKSSASSMAQNRDQDGPAGRTESASSGVAAQLPRRLSASADLDPGSAVQIVSICPGSAASSMRL